MEIKTDLADSCDYSEGHKITIGINERAVWLEFAGYGDKPSVAGCGIPVLIEMREGVPHVVVWADINREDATHVISLAGAQESKRV